MWAPLLRVMLYKVTGDFLVHCKPVNESLRQEKISNKTNQPAGIYALFLLTTLMLAACGSNDGSKPAGGRFGPSGAAKVIATQVRTDSFVDRFTALGTAKANESVDMVSKISNIVTRVAFEDGQQVDEGDLLVELDSKESRAEIAVAEASLQKVRGKYARSKSLGKTRVVSEAELEELAAEVQMAEAQLRSARVRLENNYIRAPFSGTVGLRRISPGDLVGPTTVIATLDDTSTIRLEFAIPEILLANLTVGEQVSARSVVFNQRVFTGAISSIDSRVDPVTRSVNVIARIANDDSALKPGMFLTVDIEKHRDSVLLIPEGALVPRQGRQYVYMVEDGKAVERMVTIGSRAPGFAEVRSGLKAGDTIIVEGTMRVRNGVPVSIIASPPGS